MALHTESTAVTQFAGGQQYAGQQVAAAASGVRAQVGALIPTFGLIGAEFLSAVSYVVDHQATRFDATAADHAGLSTRSDRANASYSATDRTAQRGLEVA